VLVSPQLLSRRRVQPVPNVAASARQVLQLDKVGPAAPAPGAPRTPPPAMGVEVPNLVGMSIDQARERIRAARDLSIGAVAVPVRRRERRLLVLEVAQRSTEPTGTVLRQSPAPGTRVMQGASIELVIAKR
jgi:hypothetical protein